MKCKTTPLSDELPKLMACKIGKIGELKRFTLLPLDGRCQDFLLLNHP
jgi:hypothetical protein